MNNRDVDIDSVVKVIADFGGRRKRVARSLWKAKWLPVIVMLCRWYGVFDFYSNPREIFLDYRENEPPIWFFYLVTYVLLPYYMYDKARTHELCWRWRIPLIYFVGVNIIHLVHWSVVIRMDMMCLDFSLIGLILLLYAYVGIKRIQNCCGGTSHACRQG